MTDESRLAQEKLKKGQRNRDPALVKEAALQFQALQDKQGLAECYALLGEMRFSAGDYVQSADYYKQCLEIHKSLQSKKGEAESLYFLSRCAAFTPGALEGCDESSFLKAALSIAEGIAERELQLQCCVKLGACLREKEPEAARLCYQKALQLLAEAEAGWQSGICHQGLAHLYARASDNLKARKHYLASIDGFENASAQGKESGVDLRQAQCYESLGDLALREGDEDEAIERYETALGIMESARLPGSQRVREKLARVQSDE